MHSVAGGQGQGQDRSGGVPQVVVNAPVSENEGTSWANVAGRVGAQGAAGGHGHGHQLHLPPHGGRGRLGSDAEKRKRDEEFRAPGRPRAKKVAIGKSTVIVEDGGEAAPLCIMLVILPLEPPLRSSMQYW